MIYNVLMVVIFVIWQLFFNREMVLPLIEIKLFKFDNQNYLVKMFH